jgi:hypothetical protein
MAKATLPRSSVSGNIACLVGWADQGRDGHRYLFGALALCDNVNDSFRSIERQQRLMSFCEVFELLFCTHHQV